MLYPVYIAKEGQCFILCAHTKKENAHKRIAAKAKGQPESNTHRRIQKNRMEQQQKKYLNSSTESDMTTAN